MNIPERTFAITGFAPTIRMQWWGVTGITLDPINKATFFGRLTLKLPGRVLRWLVGHPSKPPADHVVPYRGWELGYDFDYGYWTGHGYVAYKGGADLDAPMITAKSWVELLDEIDAEEDE